MKFIKSKLPANTVIYPVFFAVVILLTAIINFTGCTQEPKNCASGICVDLDLTEAKLQELLDNKCMGYGYVISQNSAPVRTHAWGLRRIDFDGGELPFVLSSRLQTASMSKTITAAATLKLLDKNNLNTYTKIADYLPPDWTLGSNIDQLTFRDLLRHESGIITGNNDCPNDNLYSSLKCYIEKGVQASDIGFQRYENQNYGLLRVLISKLAGNEHLTEGNDIAAANNYIAYVQNEILSPAGIIGASCSKPLISDMYYYKFPNDHTYGHSFDDYTLVSGPGGWYLTLTEYSAFLNRLFIEKSLMKPSLTDTMLANNLGCWESTGEAGIYKKHNGGVTFGYTDEQKYIHIGTMSGAWMYFPATGVVIVVIANSNIDGNIEDIILKSHDAGLYN